MGICSLSSLVAGRTWVAVAVAVLLTSGMSSGAGGHVFTADAIEDLRAQGAGDFRAAKLLGYHCVNDGGGGVFIWHAEYAGDVDGDMRIRPPDVDSGAWIRSVSDGTLNVKWFGAKGDGKADDTRAIKAALVESKRLIDVSYSPDATSGYINATVFFPPGDYHVSEQLNVVGGPLRIQGCGVEGAGRSLLRYVGNDFVDLLNIDLTGPGAREVKIFDMIMCGGDYHNARARYVVNASRFTRHAIIERCVIRDGIGLLRLDGCWYASVKDTSIRNVVPKPTWLAVEQLNEVHGPGSAPIYLTGGGSFSLNRVAMFYLALDRDMPVCTTRSVFIRSQASEIDTCSIENVGSPRSNWGANAYPDNLLWVSGNVNVAQMYMEGCRASEALVKVQGGSTLSTLNQPMLYYASAPVIFDNDSVGDLVVRDGFFYRINANRLWECASPASSVVFNNSLVMAGERRGNRTSGFHYDLAGTEYSPLGMADGVGGRDEIRQTFPKIVNGYDIEFGSDKKGPFVAVDGGGFIRTSGSVVGNRQLSMADTVESVDAPETADDAAIYRKQFLRFDADAAQRRGRWYRVMIGRGGQPYLVKHSSAPTLKTGDWIVQFRLGDNDKPNDLKRNPLLDLDGRYMGITGDVSVHVADAPPREGFWVAGDRVIATTPSSDGTVEWICTQGGSPGVWKSVKIAR